MSNETNIEYTDRNSQREPKYELVDKIALLAKQQGVEPVTNFDDLLGDFWPEDESADEFIAAVQEWNYEGSRRIIP